MARNIGIYYSAVLFIFSHLFSGATGESCYYPDGSTDSGHFACSSGGTSVCCAEGFQCLSNGLCKDYRYNNYERVLRGGCTDKSWGDGCPQRCTSIWPQGDEVVYVCSNGKFCCGWSKDCCEDSSAEFFDFGSPKIIATAGKTQATAAPEDENLKATAAGSSKTTEPATRIAPQSGSGSDPAITNGSNSYTSTTSNSNNHTVAIAAGVGVGVGVVIVILAVAGCWYMRRKRQRPGLRSREVVEIGESSTSAAEAEDNSSGAGLGSKARRSDKVFELDSHAMGAELPVGHGAEEMHGGTAEGGKWPGMLR